MFSEEPPATPRIRKGTSGHLRDALLTLADGHARIEAHREKSWASVTFAGARHRLLLVFEGEAAVGAGELFIANLPEHEFAIPGQLVAEATVAAVEHHLAPPHMTVTCELLLLEDA